MYQQPNIGNNVSPPRMAHNGYTHGVGQQESFYSQQDVLNSPNYSIQHGAAYNPPHHQLNHTQPSVAHHHGHIPHQNLSMPSQMGVQQPHNYYTPQSHTMMQNTSYQQHNPQTFAMKNNNNNHSLPPTTPNYYVQPTAYHMQNNIYHPTQQYPTQTPISQPPAWETPPHNILHPQLSGTHLQSPKSDLSNSPVSNNGNDSKSSRANRSFTCPKCSKVFKRGDHLKRHLLSVHDREHPYQCGECSKGFASASSLLKHSKASHSAASTKGHLCVRCNLRILNASEFQSHATSLHEAQDLEYMKNINQHSRTYSCTLCNKTVSSEKNLKRHVKKLHGDIADDKLVKSQPNMDAVSTTTPPIPVKTAVVEQHPDQESGPDKSVDEQCSAPTISTHQPSINTDQPLKPEVNNTSPPLHAVPAVKPESPIHMMPAEKLSPKNSEDAKTSCANMIEQSVLKAQQPIIDQQPTKTCEPAQFAPALTYAEPSSVSEAFSMAMKALSDFSYEDLSYPTNDYLSAGPSVFQSNSPLPNFHYPSRVRIQADNMEAQTYLDNPSEPQPTETYIAETYPEIQNFSANCQGGAIEKNQIDKTAEIIPENINFNIKKGRPKKKRKREEDDAMVGRAGKDAGDKSVSFACTVCNEVYEGIDKLMQHIEGVHLSLNPHECCICHKRFAQAGNVKRHIRFVHLRERPFECRECNSTFDRLCYLQRHMRTHIDTKANSPVASQLSPCNCPECGKRCLTSHHLRGHLQRKHFAKNKKRSDDMFSKYGHLFSNLEQTEMTMVQPQTMDHDTHTSMPSAQAITKKSNNFMNPGSNHFQHEVIASYNPPKHLVSSHASANTQRPDGFTQNTPNLTSLLRNNDDDNTPVLRQTGSNQFQSVSLKKVSSVRPSVKRKKKLYYGRELIRNLRSKIGLRFKCHCCHHPGFAKIYLLKSHLASVHHSTTKCHICIGCGKSFSTSTSLTQHVRTRHPTKNRSCPLKSQQKKQNECGNYSKIPSLHVSNNLSVLGHFTYEKPQAIFESIPQLSSLVRAEM